MATSGVAKEANRHGASKRRHRIQSSVEAGAAVPAFHLPFYLCDKTSQLSSPLFRAMGQRTRRKSQRDVDYSKVRAVWTVGRDTMAKVTEVYFLVLQAICTYKVGK